MSTPHLLLALVALQRLAELALSRRNVRRLLSAGGVEVGAGHYPFLVLLHGAWLASLWLLVPAGTPVGWSWIGVFLLLQAGRGWVMLTLGPRWTTPIIHLPGVAPIASGPYRFCRHPNYLVVAGEIAVLPLALGQPLMALVFSLLNGLLIAWRIRVENAALALRPASGYMLRVNIADE